MGGCRASLPRFQRVAPSPTVILTDDDLEIMKQVHRCRFIRANDLYRLFAGRSPDRLSRRLTQLYRAAFLDRPIAQIDRFRGGGSQHLVYGLAARGARYLAEHTSLRDLSHDLGSRNRRYTRENLDHTLAIATFLVDLELGCREAAHVSFITPEAISATPPRWSVTLPWRGSRADVLLVPDAVFGLEMARDEGRPLRSFYFVEVDRGSMTIAPSEQSRRSDAFLYRSSVLRKLFAYAISHREGAHQAALGVRAARVLMLTTNPVRAAEMQRAAERLVLPHLPVPPGLFLFGSLPDGDSLSMSLVDASGRRASIMPD